MNIKGINTGSNQKNTKYKSIATEFKNATIKDARLVKRLKETALLLAENPGKSIPEACQSLAKMKGTYRLLKNKKVNPDLIQSGHRLETLKRIEEFKLILSIQDSSTFDFTTHPGTLGLGPTSTADGLLGLITHTALAVNTDGTPLGILAQKIWARDPKTKGKSKQRKDLPIEEKESYKWLEIMDKSLEGIPDTTMVVTIGDREADIYELFHKAYREGRHLLIRATHDRRVNEEHKKLYAQINNSSILGVCVVEIPRATDLNLPPREAILKLQSCKVEICPPANSKDRLLPEIELYVVLAKEVSPPQGINPIEWLLLTTLRVETVEEVIEKVNWYRHRWKIERFHFVLKSGCKIEDLQLETSDRLKNAIALYSVLAWRLTWITYQSRETPDAPCTLILKDHEWKILYWQLNRTSRLPKKTPTLKEAVVLIARLGGFLARKHDGDPGIKVLWRGFRELESITKAYQCLKSLPSL